MKNVLVNIAEGKKSFSRLVAEASRKKEDIVVTKRGKPVAVIVSYSEYQRTKQFKAYKKILESRGAFVKAGVSARKVYELSKKELERRR